MAPDTLLASGMTKEKFIAEIKRVARETGRAPGRRRFEVNTGIRPSEWYPHIWLRWSDALADAGLEPNARQEKLDIAILIENYAELIRELGAIPVVGEIRRKARQDSGFPSHTVFGRLGNKRERIQSVIEHCREAGGYDDVIAVCDAYLGALPPSERSRQESPGAPRIMTGHVYLMRSGKHFKIGRTNSIGRRDSELAIKIPIRPKVIHTIETDDPPGVEAYWHRRFADRRGEGEWFSLRPDDVEAFKRWRRIV